MSKKQWLEFNTGIKSPASHDFHRLDSSVQPYLLCGGVPKRSCQRKDKIRSDLSNVRRDLFPSASCTVVSGPPVIRSAMGCATAVKDALTGCRL